MEAVGSRMGRASSRYGTPTVFSGPVRKWKKKWVHVASPSVSYHNSHSYATSQNNNNGGSHLLLCRWTPITTPTNAACEAGNSSPNVSDEPPRRKFRYTPIAVLEEQKKAVAKKPQYEAAADTDQSTTSRTNVIPGMSRKLNINEISEKETQDSNIDQLDLALGLKGDDGDNSQNSDEQLKRTSSNGWSMN